MRYDNVIVFGTIAYDEIMDFPGRFIDYLDAKKLHQINVSFVVDRLEKQLGGIATNIAYNLRLLSPVKISVVSAVGLDGIDFIDFFKKNFIITDMILVDKTKFTATGKVITDKADNQIWGYYYGPLMRAKEIRIKKIASRNTLCILSATSKEAFLAHQEQLITSKIDYLYDPGMTLTWIAKDELRFGVERCRFLVGNDYEIAQILKVTGLEKRMIFHKGIAIITTLGEKGVKYQSKTEKILVPAYPVKQIIDPTGAGDAWRGGFVAGIIESRSIVDCLIQANALASFAVERYGTVNHKPMRKIIEERIKTIKRLLN